MSSTTLRMTDDLLEYLRSVGVRSDGVLDDLRAETATLEWGRMQISPEQGQLMELLVRLMGARRAIEVGTFTGYSALVTARGLGPGGHLVACDVNEETTAIARRYWERAGVADRIDLRIAPAVETLDALLADGQAGTYDFAFIDADKTSYDAYYERVLQLLRPGGLLGVDNVLWSGSVADPDDTSPSTVALRALNAKIRQDDRVNNVLVPIGDGLMLVVKA